MDITITRPKQFTDKIRDYYLWADDIEVGKIKPNSSATFTIPDNTKKIRATIDWCSSPEFDISAMESNKLTVFNSFGNNFMASLFLPLYYVTFGKDKYLTIKSGK